MLVWQSMEEFAREWLLFSSMTTADTIRHVPRARRNQSLDLHTDSTRIRNGFVTRLANKINNDRDSEEIANKNWENPSKPLRTHSIEIMTDKNKVTLFFFFAEMAD